MGTQRGQVPESFLRQSVSIKVRVTVGELKQNQELQRSTEEVGEGRQEGWGGAERAPRDRLPPPAVHADRLHSIQKRPGPSCLQPYWCMLYPTSQGGLSREPQDFLLFHRFKAKAGAVVPRSMACAACPAPFPVCFFSCSPATVLPPAKASRRGRDALEGFKRQQSACLEFMCDEVNSRSLSRSPCSCPARA